MLKILFDDREYFAITNLSGTHNIDRNLALKQVRVNSVATGSFRDFLVELNFKGLMLAKVFVKDKLFLEGFINEDSFDYRDTASGTEIDLTINDRFIGFKESDIIKTKPQGSVQGFIASVLHELNFDGKLYKDSYQKTIKTSADFVVNGNGVTPKSIKSFIRNDLVEKDNSSMIGEILSLSKLILISNGYDTLTLEIPNSNPDPVFFLTRGGLGCNIGYGEKTNQNSNFLSPSKIIILNSSDKKDKNTSVVSYYNAGLPHIQKVKHLGVDASYQDIANSLNFNFAGIRARANSFLYKSPNVIFDANGEFFIPNRVVKVNDEKYGISENMTIMQAGFHIDANAGTELVLNLTTKNAFDNNSGLKQKRSLMRK